MAFISGNRVSVPSILFLLSLIKLALRIPGNQWQSVFFVAGKVGGGATDLF